MVWHTQQKMSEHQSFQSVQFLQETIEEFIETWNKFFAHPFTWKYTGEGLHEKAITRFNKILFLESKQMDIKFLTKQLLLISNIAKTYYGEVRTTVWKQLHDLIVEKIDYIHGIISGVKKERQIIKAQNALDQLNFFMT